MSKHSNKNKCKEKAIIPDEECMKSASWLDYTTQEKNDQYISDLEEASKSSPEELLAFIKGRMNGWILDDCDEYDVDLKKLSDNWRALCDKFGLPTKKILLVECCYFNEKEETNRHKNVMATSEKLVRAGYVVKDFNHFKICTGCRKLMLSDSVQQQLWHTKNIWKVCRRCTQNSV